MTWKFGQLCVCVCVSSFHWLVAGSFQVMDGVFHVPGSKKTPCIK